MDRAPADAELFTVLIVDDDAVLQHALASVLTPLGYRVLPAANAEQACERLDHGPVDAVLLDVRLPTISGLDLYLVIEQRWPYLAPRLALVTGDADAADVRTWRGARHPTLFRKPFHPHEILRWLEALKRS
jgi:CheY-like chemotaxis protein